MGISYGSGGGGAGVQGGGGGGGWNPDVIGLIKPLARAMTAEDVPVAAQVKILLRLGVKIGSGGKGGKGSGSAECMYCHQTGNGGHGGFCPNGAW